MNHSTVTKVVSLLFLLSLLFIPRGSEAQEKQIALKVIHSWPVEHKGALMFDQWGKDLEKRTNGRVKVTIYPASVLVPLPQSYDALVKGIGDVGGVVAGMTAGRFPLLDALDLPHSFPSSAAATKMMNAFYAKFKPKEVDATKILFFTAMPPQFMLTKAKPVAKLEDLKGMKIRTSGTNTKFVGNLGAIPVAMPISDVYDALAKGVVDGLVSQYESLSGFALADHIRYATENRDTSFTSLFMFPMNKNKWNSLPKDIQDTIDKMSPEYAEKFANEVWDYLSTTGKELLIKKGGKVITLTREEEARWAEKAKPLVDEYVKNTKAKGLPGEEAIKFIGDYAKSHKQS